MFLIREHSVEVDDCYLNLEQLENELTRKAVMFCLRLSEAATEQVSLKK